VAIKVRVTKSDEEEDKMEEEERDEVAGVMAEKLAVAEEGKTEEVELGSTREGVSVARSCS
jgi:inner membrane protein involved in colicin E2 resistance